ncbi:MAG TPA: LuxR C-terminal-related transcriptional regulator, partial [Solirubrobacteraceae bacterium]|nr:LuxR C-terminal-related transcriptional regulator [Solirubrobacteraceae bacterium]
DPARFWAAVTDSLWSSGALAEQPAPPAAGRLHELLDGLAGALREHADPVLLVVDDLHRLETQTARDGLAALLERDLPQLRMLLLTRRVPRLGLHRLRVLGGVTEIRGPDLAFTLPEAGELLAAAGVQLSDERLALLHQRTEGWAAGLRLAALALAGRADPDMLAGRFSGADRTVAEYLGDEVLAGQPPAVRRLLRRTSLLARVNGPLANLLTGRSDSERVLQELEDANAFVFSLDAGRAWFRYHHLVADLLRMELRREAPEEIGALHRMAARWHAGQGSPHEAIRHALSGADRRFAADLLMDHWFDLVVDGQQSTLGRLLAAFPAEQLRTDPELAALAAADRLAAGRPDVADAYLALAERLAAAAPDPLPPRFEVMLTVVRLERARVRGDVDAAVEAADAILAPAHGERWVDFASNEDLRALALMHLGYLEAWSWRLESAEHHLEEALALARQLGRPYLAIGCLATLAELGNVTQQLAPAERRAREAIELAERLGWSEDPVVGAAASALGATLLGRGRLEASEGWLDRAARLLQGGRDPATSVLLHFNQGLLRFAQGRYDGARSAFRDAELAQEHLSLPRQLATAATTWQMRAAIRLGDLAPARAALAAAGDAVGRVAEWCNLAAHLALAEDDPQAALGRLEPVFDGSASGFHLVLELEALLLEAVARDRLAGEQAAAEATLERLLERAAPVGQVWIILTVPAVLPLLQRHPRHRTAHAAFIAELLDHFAGVTTPGVPDDVLREAESLSAREREVLGFLPTNLTAAEIAREMVVSVHTVKTHMRAVYAKLGVHRRANAVERARAIGLLAPSRRGR